MINKSEIQILVGNSRKIYLLFLDTSLFLASNLGPFNMPHAGNDYAWLPNDQNPRTDLDISNLDLDTNYLEFLEDSSTEKSKPQTPKREWKRWYKETPLEDPKLLPDGWHMNEPDLEIG